MTWVLHKGHRDRIINIAAFDEVHQQQCSIILIRGECLRIMEYNDEKEAGQAFGYLMEAIKRGDHLVNI